MIESKHHERPQLDCNGIACYRTNNSYAHFLYKTIVLSALLKNVTTVDPGLDYRMAMNRVSSLGLVEGLAFDDSRHTLFSSSIVLISQATNGRLVDVGYYHSKQGCLNISNNSVLEHQIPPSIVFRSRLVFLSVASYTEIILCFLLVTVDLILYIYYRKEPEVKATSFSVSMSMFLASYVLILYLIILATDAIHTRHNSAICLARSWLNLLSLPAKQLQKSWEMVL